MTADHSIEETMALVQRIADSTSVTVKPVNAMMVVMTVHERSVSFSLISRYLLTSQNPESLTCESIVAPEDIAITRTASIAAESS